MKHASRTAVFILALVLCAGSAFAQGVTTGAIFGTVNDSEGGALPGVVINAASEDFGTTYTAATDSFGRFKIVNMRVGSYTVTATLEGFKDAVASSVAARLGGDTTLTFTMQLDTVTEELVVVGESSPLISASRTGAASNVSLEAIETLPTISRGFEEFARTNPFMTVAAENEDPNSISVAGRNSRYNNIQIDGAVNNDIFGLADTGTPGGQADATPVSLDAIQEIELVIAEFDVRQGGFSGGSINAITRSGSNNWAGSAFYYTRDESLIGDLEALGEFGDFSDDQWGFRIGGPISQDKIFFFGNYENVEKSQPTGWSVNGDGGQCFASCGVTDEADIFQSTLLDLYGYDPGQQSQNTRDTPSDKYFLRFDFNIGSNNTLTLRHNYVDAQNLINRPRDSTYEWPGEAYAFASETNTTVGQFNTVISATKFNELRLTYQTVQDNRGDGTGQRFPWIEIEDVDGIFREFEAGTEAFSTRNSLDQDVFELTDDFTMIKGNHTITIGTHNEFFQFDNLFIQNAFGAYEFQGIEGWQSGIATRRRLTIPAPGQPESQQFSVNQIGLYAGDQWLAKPNLTLTYGLRVDVPFFPDKPTRNPFTEETFGYRTDEMPDGNILWQPRVGFNWDVNSDGMNQVRGGLGVFAGRTPYVWISNQYSRTGLEQINFTDNDVPFEPDPDNQTIYPGEGTVGEYNLVDPDFDFPTVLRLNLAYDRQLPWNMVGSVEFLFSDSLKEIDYNNVNLEQIGNLPFDGRPEYGPISNADGAYLLKNTSEGKATNVSFKVERPYRDGWWGFASYAYGDSEIVNDGGSSRAVSNFNFNETFDPQHAPASTSEFRVEHRFNIGASYRLNRNSRYPTTVSMFYNLQSGRPYATIWDSDFVGFGFGASMNGDESDGNDLMYIPSGPDDVVIENGTWEQLDAYIRSESCLDNSRGEVVKRNCSSAPWNETLDLRIAQDIPIGPTTLQLSFDIQNLANLFDEDAGLLRYANFNAVTPVELEEIDAQGRPVITLRDNVTDPENNPKFETHNVLSRWRGRFGARLTF